MDVAAAKTAEQENQKNSTNPRKPGRDEYMDPKGYWIDPDRNIRRLGDKDGEQVAVLRATACCSDAEWDRFYKAIVACLDATPTSRVRSVSSR